MDFDALSIEIEALPNRMPTKEQYGLTDDVCIIADAASGQASELSAYTGLVVGSALYVLTALYLNIVQDWSGWLVLPLSVMGGWIPFFLIGAFISKNVKALERACLANSTLKACEIYTKEILCTKRRYLEAFGKLGVIFESSHLSAYPNHNVLIDIWTNFFTSKKEAATYYPANHLKVPKENFAKFFLHNMILGVWLNKRDYYLIFCLNYEGNLTSLVEGLEKPITDPVYRHKVETEAAAAKGIAIDEQENNKTFLRLCCSQDHKEYMEILEKVNRESDKNRIVCNLLEKLVKKTKASGVGVFGVAIDAIK
jgi:hypothetical protein